MERRDIVDQLRLTPMIFMPDRLGQLVPNQMVTSLAINTEARDVMLEAADEIERLRRAIASASSESVGAK